jgi:hypothetical protein
LATTLELFLQGGVGNQLIQQAYAESLVSHSDVRLRLNPVLLSPAWAALRGVTFRQHSGWLGGDASETRPWLRQWFQLCRFYLARPRGLVVHEGLSDDQVQALLTTDPPPGWLPLLGYFQRAKAFGPAAEGFWVRLAERLRHEHQLRPHPEGQVALHVRLGDYLLPQNQRLYATAAIEQQLHAALTWRERLGGQAPLQVVTDDPVVFRRLCPEAYRGTVRLLASRDPQEDFLALCCHRRIVASNSTFSLCAGKIASILWGEAQTILLPRHWYREPSRDGHQQQEWGQLTFVVDRWPVQEP